MLGSVRFLLWQVARSQLAAELPAGRTEAVLSDATVSYRQRVAQLPAEPTWTARSMLQLAAAAAALHDALLTEAMGAERARALVRACVWPVFARTLAPVKWLTERIERDPVKRLQGVVGLMRSRVFCAPAWPGRDLDGDGSDTRFEIERCPLADYLGGQGLSDLCVAAFCDGDLRMADQLGVVLERSGTLAAGAPRCDFRWRVA